LSHPDDRTDRTPGNPAGHLTAWWGVRHLLTGMFFSVSQ